MPGKKFRQMLDSAYKKRTIMKLHNGRERKCVTSAAVFRLYWRPHCEIRTVLSITIARGLCTVFAHWLNSLSWPNTAATHQIHLSTWKGICRHFTRPRTFFLSFHTSKATHAEANCQDWDPRKLIANQGANEGRHNSAAKRRRQVHQERLERGNQWADLIWRENHFNFIKMHYLSHFASHVRHFESISMYFSEIGELAHNKQIKDSYQRSNKNETARQILSQYGRQHILGMHLQIVFVTGRGGAGFLRMAPPSLRLGVKILPLLPAPSSMGPRTGPGAGRVVFFPRQVVRRAPFYNPPFCTLCGTLSLTPSDIQ